MLITASLATAPPAKPQTRAKTGRRSQKYYTIHTQPNDAFTLRVAETARTSVVGFRDWDDALFIGKMMETHFMRQKEWPDTRSVGSLILPSSQVGDVLRYLYIQQWDFDELKLTCTKNFLDMISVDGIVKKKANAGYTFSGNLFKFEAPREFYIQRLDEIFEN